MTTPHQRTGNRGEQLAIVYLRERDYNILATNWHCPRGEIDIIAQNGPTIVFVEVRTRRTTSTASAFASITLSKQQKLTQTAHLYLHEHNIDDQTPWRIDVIAIALPTGKKPVIDHVEDALGW